MGDPAQAVEAEEAMIRAALGPAAVSRGEAAAAPERAEAEVPQATGFRWVRPSPKGFGTG